MGTKGPADVFYQGLGGVLQDAPLPEDPDGENAKIDAIETEAAKGLDKTAQQATRPVTKNNLFSLGNHCQGRGRAVLFPCKAVIRPYNRVVGNSDT